MQINTANTDVREYKDGGLTLIVESRFYGKVTAEEAFAQLILSRMKQNPLKDTINLLPNP